MRTKLILVIATVALLLVGCQNDPKKAVIGTWKPDGNSLKIDWGEQGKNPQFQAIKGQYEGKMKESLNKMTVTFKEDGTYTGTDPDGTNNGGKWTLSGNNLTVTPDTKKTDSPTPTLTVQPDGKTMSAHMAQQGVTVDMNFVKSS